MPAVAFVFSSLVLPLLASAPRANVVVILADDWGFANAGYHREDGGGDEARTPHIDALAASGVRLERMYAHAFCGPSRCALLSGRLPLHVELQGERSPTRDASDPDKGYYGVPRNMSTLGDVAKAAGYATHFVGKWDAGYASPRHTPAGRGFDASLAYFYQVNDYWTMRTYKSEASGCDAYLNASSELVVDLWEDDHPARAFNGTAHEDGLELFKRAAARSLGVNEATCPFERIGGTPPQSATTGSEPHLYVPILEEIIDKPKCGKAIVSSKKVPASGTCESLGYDKWVVTTSLCSVLRRHSKWWWNKNKYNEKPSSSSSRGACDKNQ